jgi:PAS domain S-box-containing protein
MNNISIRQKIIFFALLILTGNSFIGFTVYKSNQTLIESARWIEHTEQVISLSNHILSISKDIQSAAHGYTITGDTSYLTPLYDIEHVIATNIEQLRKLTQDNVGEKGNISSLSYYMHKRLQFSLQTIEVKKQKGLAPAMVLVAAKGGKNYSDSIQQITESIAQKENILLEKRKATNARSMATFNILTVAIICLMFVFAILLILVTRNYLLQSKEKEKRAAELIVANKELAFQNTEKENRAAELVIANKELIFQNEEKENRARELIVANKELAFQNTEKENRAAELVVANKELVFQNKEKENRAFELIVANKELAFQNTEKENRAAELIVANKELAFQNTQKEGRAAELVLANKELIFQNEEKEKTAQEKILSEIRLAKAQQIAHMGSWELDFETNTVIFSTEACRIAGLSALNQRHDLPECMTFLHPLDYDMVIKLIKESYKAANDVSFEHRIITKQGNVRHILSVSKFECDENKKPLSLYGIAYDITDKKRAEEQLEFDKKNLDALINNTTDLMWSIDPDFKLITSNNAFDELILQWTGKELTKGMDMKNIVPGAEMLARYKGYYERALAGDTFSEIEYNNTDGESWRTISFYPIHLAGEIIGTACHSHNITAIKKAEKEIISLNENLEKRIAGRTAELTEANKALESFSYSVSHDLRAPVRAVISFAKIISKDYSHTFTTEVADLFTHIESCSKRMNTIIDDLLSLARHSKDPVKVVDIDMNKLVHEVWDKIKFMSPNNARLLNGSLPHLKGDISMLEQVVVNLLSNAIKYSSKKGSPLVEVGFEKTAHETIFFVKDNGAGFDMKYYDKLFGAFQRLHGTSEFEGTGIGLLLVKRIIERHGGSVWGEGKVDEGATFYFSLPTVL